MTSSSKQHGASAKRRSASLGGSSRSSSSRSRSKSPRTRSTVSARGTAAARRGVSTSHTRTSRAQARPQARARRRSPVDALRSRLAFLSRPALALVALLALAATIWSFYPVLRVQYREERAYARLNAEYESVQARNARLKKQVARLQTNAGVEDEAREVGLVLPGEHPVVVTDKSQPATQAVAQKDFQVQPEQPVRAPSGPWTPVLDFIFGVQE